MGNYFGQGQVRAMPELPPTCLTGNQNVSYKLVKSWQDAGLPLCGPKTWPTCTRLPWPDDHGITQAWQTAFNDVMDYWDKGHYEKSPSGEPIDWSQINKGDMRADPCDGTESWIQEFTTPVLVVGGMVLWNMVSPFEGSAKGITTLSVGGFGYFYGQAIYAKGDEREKYGDYCMRFAGAFAGGAVGGLIGMADESGEMGNLMPVVGGGVGAFFGPQILKEIPILNPIIPHKSGGGGSLFGILSWAFGLVSWINQKFRFTLCFMLYKFKGECFGRVHWRLDTFAAAVAYHVFPTDKQKRRRLFNAIISDFSQYAIETLPNEQWGSHNIWQGSQRYLATCQDVKILLNPDSYGNRTYYGTEWVANYQALIDKVKSEAADAPIYIPKITCETVVTAAYNQSSIAKAAEMALDTVRGKDCKFGVVLDTLLLLATNNTLRPYRDLLKIFKLQSKGDPARLCQNIDIIMGNYSAGSPLANSLRNRFIHHTSPAAIKEINQISALCGGHSKPPPNPVTCSTFFAQILNHTHRQYTLAEFGSDLRPWLVHAVESKWKINGPGWGIPLDCDESAWGLYAALACFGKPGAQHSSQIATPAEFLRTFKVYFTTASQQAAAVNTLIPMYRKWLPPWYSVKENVPGGGQINWYFNHNKDDPAAKEIAAMVPDDSPVSFAGLWWTPQAMKNKKPSKGAGAGHHIYTKPFKHVGPTSVPSSFKPLGPTNYPGSFKPLGPTSVPGSFKPLGPTSVPSSFKPLQDPHAFKPLRAPNSFEPLKAPGSFVPLQAPGSFKPLQAPHSFEPLQAPGSFKPLQAPHSFKPLQAPHSFEPLQAPGSFKPMRAPNSFKPLGPGAPMPKHNKCDTYMVDLSSEKWVRAATTQQVKTVIGYAVTQCKDMPSEILYYISAATTDAECEKYWSGLAKQPAGVQGQTSRLLIPNLRYPHDIQGFKLFGDYVKSSAARQKQLAQWAKGH